MFILRDIKTHKCTNPEIQRSLIPFPIRLTRALKKTIVYWQKVSINF